MVDWENLFYPGFANSHQDLERVVFLVVVDAVSNIPRCSNFERYWIIAVLLWKNYHALFSQKFGNHSAV